MYVLPDPKEISYTVIIDNIFKIIDWLPINIVIQYKTNHKLNN